MRDIEVLKLNAREAFQELLDSIDGVTENQAWAKVDCQPGEYMHTEGSILSNVLHVAGGKFIYGSAAYRDLEVRWRDVVGRFESFWPSWDKTKEYLYEAQDYWLSFWAKEDDIERLVTRFDGNQWPSWKIIWTVTDHDGYHAGQTQMLRSILAPSLSPPPGEADLWRKYCGETPSW